MKGEVWLKLSARAGVREKANVPGSLTPGMVAKATADATTPVVGA